MTVLDPAQIGLIEAASLTELNLAHARLHAELSDALAEFLRQPTFHPPKCRCYALIRINTNSYKRGEETPNAD